MNRKLFLPLIVLTIVALSAPLAAQRDSASSRGGFGGQEPGRTSESTRSHRSDSRDSDRNRSDRNRRDNRSDSGHRGDRSHGTVEYREVVVREAGYWKTVNERVWVAGYERVIEERVWVPGYWETHYHEVRSNGVTVRVPRRTLVEGYYRTDRRVVSYPGYWKTESKRIWVPGRSYVKRVRIG